jgi:hypothetical protein
MNSVNFILYGKCDFEIQSRVFIQAEYSQGNKPCEYLPNKGYLEKVADRLKCWNELQFAAFKIKWQAIQIGVGCGVGVQVAQAMSYFKVSKLFLFSGLCLFSLSLVCHYRENEAQLQIWEWSIPWDIRALADESKKLLVEKNAIEGLSNETFAKLLFESKRSSPSFFQEKVSRVARLFHFVQASFWKKLG